MWPPTSQRLVVAIPTYLNITSLNRLFSAAIDVNGSPLSLNLILDFSNLAFADENGVTVLSNLVDWLIKKRAHVTFGSSGGLTPGTVYLDDCGFFEVYWGKPLRAFASVRNTTMPFKRISPEHSFSWFDGNVFPWLAATLNLPLSRVKTLNSCTSEIFHNIRDHSTEKIGCMHIQHYPSLKKVGISISDFGVGIPTELGKRYHCDSDADALILATKYGVTSKPGGKNGGNGLAILVDQVVGLNAGMINLISGFGRLVCLQNNGRIEKFADVSQQFYPGTLINLKLNTDRLPDDEFEV